MEIRTESHEGPAVGSPSVTIHQFEQHTRVCQREWLERLSDEPDTFSEIEQEIDQHYRLGAGNLAAALLQQATSRSSMAEHVERIRQEAALESKSPQPRPLRVRLLCGLVLFVSTSYCAPDGRKLRARQLLGAHAGLYPELAAFGFGKGCSPALQYKVARIVALSPSMEVARKELGREGIQLDKKTVRRIAEQLGTQLLALRQRELLAWRAGLLAAGSDFVGRRVVVQIDGGRIRVRENKKKRTGRVANKKRRLPTTCIGWEWPRPRWLSSSLMGRLGYGIVWIGLNGVLGSIHRVPFTCWTSATQLITSVWPWALFLCRRSDVGRLTENCASY